MQERLNIFEITEKYIKANGFDGLLNDEDECGCLLGDLSPGSCMNQECEPAFNRGGKHGGDYWMSTEKPRKGGNE